MSDRGLSQNTRKLQTDTTHLSHLIDPLGDEPSPEQVELALSVAKRVRRESTLLVRLLASLRDQLHA